MKKYTSHLGIQVKEIEEVNVEDVIYSVAFLQVGDTNIELVHSTAKTGLVGDFLREHGEGIHHIAFEVEDIEKTFRELRSQGVEFVWDENIKGSRGTEVNLFKPEEFNGVYVELVQKH